MFSLFASRSESFPVQEQQVLTTKVLAGKRNLSCPWFSIFCLTVLIVIGFVGLGAASDKSWETFNAEGLQAYQQRHFPEAKEGFSQALSSLNTDGEPDPRRAMTLNNLAAAHEELGEYEEAELRYRQSLAIVESIQGAEHPDLLPGLTNLAILHQARQQFAQAERLYRRSLKIVERMLGESHPHLIPGLLDLARTSQAQEEYERAEDYYSRALKIGEMELAPAHHQTQSIRMQYAALLKHLNRIDEAAALEEQANRELSSPPASGPIE